MEANKEQEGSLLVPACQPHGGLGRVCGFGAPKRLYEKTHTRRALPASPLLFIPTRLLWSFNADLERVGLPKQNGEGKLDFHALRGTSITLGVEAGANLKELITLARHADRKLTLGFMPNTGTPA